LHQNTYYNWKKAVFIRETAAILKPPWQHVLCEKPMCVTFEEAKELVNLARVKAKTQNLFYMEALWSRCLPAYESLK
jgi:dihydrodiol dehydrogenase / D-xylose 1-dehydrogenase (NADP)